MGDMAGVKAECISNVMRPLVAHFNNTIEDLNEFMDQALGEIVFSKHSDTDRIEAISFTPVKGEPNV